MPLPLIHPRYHPGQVSLLLSLVFPTPPISLNPSNWCLCLLSSIRIIKRALLIGILWRSRPSFYPLENDVRLCPLPLPCSSQINISYSCDGFGWNWTTFHLSSSLLRFGFLGKNFFVLSPLPRLNISNTVFVVLRCLCLPSLSWGFSSCLSYICKMCSRPPLSQ